MSFFQHLKQWQVRKKASKARQEQEPTYHDAKSLGMTDAWLSPQAQAVLKGLTEAGYEAYIVGGGVRDVLAGQRPKDFDVVTSATPAQVKQCFPGSLIIGRRFRLVHVRFGREVIEVATFRAAADQRWPGRTKKKQQDNVFGTLQSDVWRRDFTINALYYDHQQHRVIDFVGGVDDIQAGRIKVIGDPQERLHEDPVRMLRAIRLVAKLGFQLGEDLRRAMETTKEPLSMISSDRLFVEVMKLFYTGHGVASLASLRQWDLMAQLFPDLSRQWRQDPKAAAFLEQALYNSDKRLKEGLNVNSGFLLASLLWPVFLVECEKATGSQRLYLDKLDVIGEAAQRVLSRQCRAVNFPKRCMEVAKEIWLMQASLMARPKDQVLDMPKHPRFRAAYDFLVLRAQLEEMFVRTALWWDRFQQALEPARRDMVARLRSPDERRGGKQRSGRDGNRRRKPRNQREKATRE